MIVMTVRQVVCITTVFFLIFAITFAEMRHWLPMGRVKATLIFLVGVTIIVSLRMSNMAPPWFAGGKTAFGTAAMLAGMAFLGNNAQERSFAMPLGLGMAITMCVLNVIVHF